MSTNMSDRWEGIKNRFTRLPVLVRRVHRIVAMLWVLSLALSFVISTDELPGPSIPGLAFIALVITGGFLLLGPWVRGSDTVSDRLKRLKSWNRTPSVFIRRTHRIASALFLVFLAIGLSVVATGGSESPLFLVPIAALLVYLGITGLYMFLRPWVNRFRAG